MINIMSPFYASNVTMMKIIFHQSKQIYFTMVNRAIHQGTQKYLPEQTESFIMTKRKFHYNFDDVKMNSSSMIHIKILNK